MVGSKANGEGGAASRAVTAASRRGYVTRERVVEGALRRGAERRGGLCLKFVSPGCKGVPDRVVLIPGAPPAFVEVKRPGEAPTPLQRYRIAEMRRAGARVHVLDALEGVEPLLDRIARGEQGAEPAPAARAGRRLDVVIV